jgi:hypothetical protein
MTETPLSEIYFRDQTTIDQPAKGSALSDAKVMLENSSDDSVRLVVQVDATHSGLLTNGRVYPGIHVQRGYRTFFSKDNGGLADMDKPVLKHHEHDHDAIGRIIGGQFIKSRTGSEFKNDFLNPDTVENGGKGSGVVRLQAAITDQDAIAKILDGRLVSVSSGHSSKKMTCSLCSKDLLGPMQKIFGGTDEEDDCQHIPGMSYNDDSGKGLCFGITGPLTYHEISFVNIPAQQPARLTKIDWEEVKSCDSLDGLVLPSTSRGKKSDITSMVLMDSKHHLDLLSHKVARHDNVVTVSMAVADKVISSVLDGVSSEDDPDYNAEPDQVVPSQDLGSSAKPRPGPTSDAPSQEKISDQGAVTDDRLDTDSDTSRSDDSNDRLGSTGDSMNDKKTELSTDALQASIESLTQDNESLKIQIEEKTAETDTLKSQVEGKDSEVGRLADDMSAMQGTLAKDYATIVAQYRILLEKPGTDGLDEKEKRTSYVDELATRSVDSLRDSLNDLSDEFKLFCEETEASKQKDNKGMRSGPSIEDSKLETPGLTTSIDGAKDKSSKPLSAGKAADAAFGI